MKPHPIQPLELDKHGVLRFKENKIVSWMLDMGRDGKTFDMNSIAVHDFSREDREQFAQLIGYSHSGAGSLGYMSDLVLEAAEAAYNSDLSELEARNTYLEQKLYNVSVLMRDGVADLYGKHPDDIMEIESPTDEQA